MQGRGGPVGWGTALQAGRSRVRFPLVSLVFYLLHYVPAFYSVSNRSEFQEYFLGSKGGRCLRLTTFMWEPQSIGSLQACSRITLPFTLYAVQETQMCGLAAVPAVPFWFFLSCTSKKIQVTCSLFANRCHGFNWDVLAQSLTDLLDDWVSFKQRSSFDSNGRHLL